MVFFPFPFVSFFLALLGVEIKAFTLLGKVLYHLSHTQVLFALVCLPERVLRFCPGQPLTAVILPLPPIQLGLQMRTTTPSFFFLTLGFELMALCLQNPCSSA
jgi:hypothetical protein